MIKDIKQLQVQLRTTSASLLMPCMGTWQLVKLAVRGMVCLLSGYRCCCTGAVGNSLPSFSLPPREPAAPKLVVFIDDLDRAPPTKVVDIIQAVNLILAASGVSSVIGAVSTAILHRPAVLWTWITW